MHEYPQILIPLKGSVRIGLGNLKYKAGPGEVCVIPPGLAHQCQYQGRLLVVNIPKEQLKQRDAELVNYPLVLPSGHLESCLLDGIMKELQGNAGSRNNRLLYESLYEKIQECASAASMRYIRAHYSEPVTIVKLARMENYNITYFSDWFKHRTGLSPSLYLRYARINKAKELLSGTDLSITEIALLVGYSSNATLTRAFRSLLGISPREYREYLALEAAKGA